MSEWHFNRTLPDSQELMRCLAYYRDGINAYSVGLASHAVLSFFRVFETRYDTKKKAAGWIDGVFSAAASNSLQGLLERFEVDRSSQSLGVGEYVYRYYRVATAHAARDVPSDPDDAREFRRLLDGSEIMKALARYFIEQEFKFSKSYLTDDADG
jgi:hypothetical protein